MATINFRYDQEAKEGLKQEALSLGYSGLTDYMLAIIESRKEQVLVNKKPKLVPVGKVGKIVSTRVRLDEKQKLSDYCREENEKEGAVILRQVRILLFQEPHFTKEELKSLRNATTQLTAIGRNLNQITAKINSGEITDSILSKAYIVKLKSYIDEQAKMIRGLIRKTKDRVLSDG